MILFLVNFGFDWFIFLYAMSVPFFFFLCYECTLVIKENAPQNVNDTSNPYLRKQW